MEQLQMGIAWVRGQKDTQLKMYDDFLAEVGRMARTLNYGLYRSYTLNGILYCDCGPITMCFEALK